METNEPPGYYQLTLMQGSMKKLNILFVLVVLSVSLDAQQIEPGFVWLFNGENLDGWVGNKSSYKAEDGMIVVDPQGGGSGGNLYGGRLCGCVGCTRCRDIGSTQSRLGF